MKKLFLLDAMALVYRAYFALNKNPRITSTGINTSAFLGFANTLLELLRKEKPTHIGVAFDTHAPTARQLEYTEYKANRQQMPEDIGVALPYIQRFLEALHIPVLFSEGYEADDIIGTLSKKAEKAGFTVYMVTPDKDFGQLVSENIFMYKPAHGGNGVEIMGPAEVCAKYGLENPLQVIDMLGMWGDASDNIPGIPGVGEVTARKLIAQFGSMENMLAHTEEIANEKLREKVRANVEQAVESKMLATIMLDAPVEFNEEELEVSRPDMAAVTALLDELEMRTFASRLLSYYNESSTDFSPPQSSTDFSPSQSRTDFSPFKVERTKVRSSEPEGLAPRIFILDDPARKESITIWKNEAEFEQGLQTLKTAEAGTPIAIYLHPAPTQAGIRHADMDFITFAHKENTYGYRPVGLDYKESLSAFLADSGVCARLVCYDLKSHLHLLWNAGIEGDWHVFDIMLAHYLIDPESPHDLSRLTLNYLPYDYKSDNTGKDLFTDLDEAFCLQNAALCVLLHEKFSPALDEAGARSLLEEMEIPLSAVLCRMERNGVRLDTQRLASYGKQLSEEIKQVEEEIYALAGGFRFNIASPKQLGEVLYDRLQIVEKPKKTKTKQYSTAEDVLQKVLHKHPIVEKVLRYRSLTKLVSTYIDALPALIDPKTGKVHTTFNQAVTATGRLSSQNPNLQNIPVRTELGKEIRKCFVPDNPQEVLLAADYSQIELRIIAHLSGDSVMQQDFSRHKDVHTATAANVFGVKPEEVTSEMRRKAKTVNFGIIYGISSFGLAERLQIPRKEAGDLIEKYYVNYAHLKEYMDKAVADAKEKGYTETLLHRRRYLNNINSGNAVVRAFEERNAVNAPVQGTSADMIKLAMIAVDRRLREEGFKTRMLLQVHDELVFSVPVAELDSVKEMVVTEMKNALPLSVPVEVDAKSADNWLDAH